jgi:hypothetical protein
MQTKRKIRAMVIGMALTLAVSGSAFAGGPGPKFFQQSKCMRGTACYTRAIKGLLRIKAKEGREKGGLHDTPPKPKPKPKPKAPKSPA